MNGVNMDMKKDHERSRTNDVEDITQKKYCRLLSDHHDLQQKYDCHVEQCTVVQDRHSAGLEQDGRLQGKYIALLETHIALQEKFAGLASPRSQQASTVDMLCQLPGLVLQHLCQYLDSPTLLTMCRVSKRWERVVGSLEGLWKQRCVKMGISRPIPGISWKRRLVEALCKLPEGMRNGMAFVTRELPVPGWKTESLQKLCCILYADGLLVAGNEVGGIAVWRDLSGTPSDVFFGTSAHRVVALSLRDGVLAVGSDSGDVRIEFVDANGRRKPGGWDMCVVEGPVGLLCVVPALHLLVVVHRTAGGDGTVSVVWRSLDSGTQLASSTYTHWSFDWRLVMTPAADDAPFHLALIDAKQVTLYVWPRVSSLNAPYGDVDALRRLPLIEYDPFNVNFVMHDTLVAFKSADENERTFSIFDMRSQYEECFSSRATINANLVGVRGPTLLLMLVPTSNQWWSLRAVDTTTSATVMAVRLSWIDDVRVFGDMPWLRDPHLWETGHLVMACLKENRLHVVTTRPLGEL